MDAFLKFLWDLLRSEGMQLVGVLVFGIIIGYLLYKYVHRDSITTAESQANTNKMLGEGIKVVHDTLASRYDLSTKTLEQVNKKLSKSENAISVYKEQLEFELKLKDQATKELLGLYKFALRAAPYLSDANLKHVLGSFTADERNPLLEAEAWGVKKDVANRLRERSKIDEGLLNFGKSKND